MGVVSLLVFGRCKRKDLIFNDCREKIRFIGYSFIVLLDIVRLDGLKFDDRIKSRWF